MDYLKNTSIIFYNLLRILQCLIKMIYSYNFENFYFISYLEDEFHFKNYEIIEWNLDCTKFRILN